MNVSLSANWNRMTTANPPVVKPVMKNEKAARDFEAMLLTPLLDSLQKTFAGTSADANTRGRAIIASWAPRRWPSRSRPGVELASRSSSCAICSHQRYRVGVERGFDFGR